MYNLLCNLGRLLRTYPEINLVDVFAQGQIKSKQWLIEELSNLDVEIGKTFVLGGWYGTLPAMMLESGLFPNAIFRSLDIDSSCAIIADTVNRDPWVINGWKFKASTADMFDIDYNAIEHTTYKSDGTPVHLTEEADTLINTSCEHIELSVWWDMIPMGKLVVLQSNNFEGGNGHINCVTNIVDFKDQVPMSKILFEGERNLEKYTRYMLIGYK